MKPLSLKLRGAVGIHDGLGLDDVSIDFGGFQSGLIALVGPNGSGKTTILENLHPYLQLASREGSLSNHFRLRDSYRDFTFELAGHVYRSYILIDAKTAKTEAYLYRDGTPLSDGKVNTYKAEIEKLLGSPELFFRSIFSCQNAESITSLTAGKRKELFLELLGLQRYDLYAEHCKVQADEVEKDIAGRRGRLEQIAAQTSREAVVVSELENCRKELAVVEADIKIGETQVKLRSEEIANRESRVAEDKAKHTMVHDLGNEVSVLEAKKWKLDKDHKEQLEKLGLSKKAIEEEIKRKQQIVDHKHEIEQSVIRLQTLRLELKDINERREQVLAIEREQEKGREKYQTALSDYKLACVAIANEQSGLEREKKNLIERFESDLLVCRRELMEAQRTAALVSEVPCNTVPGLPDRCKLLSTAINAKNLIRSIELRMGELGDHDYRWSNGLGALAAQYETSRTRAAELVEPTNHVDDQFAGRIASVGFDPARHLTVCKEIQTLEAKKWESLLEELRVAEATIEEKQKAIAEIAARVIETGNKHHIDAFNLGLEATEKRAKWEEIKATLLAPEFYEQLQVLRNAIVIAQAELKALTDKRSGIVGDIQFRQEMLKQLDEAEAEARSITADLQKILSQLENWRLLQRACSKDGIPALELDAAGPAVSRIANELLASTFGTRFQISFETTKMSKDNKKQLETFEIRVYGADGEKRIEDLSGGERVWIEKAIQEAIAIYLSEKSGKEYLTSYADESDGALDPDNKQHFLDMLRESFKLGRRHYTFVITQTPEIWGQIQQRVHLVPAEGRLEFVY